MSFTKQVLKKYFILLLLPLVIVIILYENYYLTMREEKLNKKAMVTDLVKHKFIVEQFYKKREHWITSNLGTMLFKNIDTVQLKNPVEATKTYVILIWKHWKWLLNRHVIGFNESRYEVENNLLKSCSSRNCIFSGDENLFESADAVVVHLQQGIIPEVKERSKNQIWIFLSDESPRNSFSLATRKVLISEIANVFNWSMTYRTSSDIPVPYGRTIPLLEPIAEDYLVSVDLTRRIPNWDKKRRDVLINILMSNCKVPHRMHFLKEFKQYIEIDIYGKCSENHKKTCPGHFKSDCEVTSLYIFYLVLENSSCQQYLTEKVFYNAYSKGAIPIIMGPSITDCEELLPPKSFIHVDHFETIEDLAKEIIRISKDENELLLYHDWRIYFEITNEHGYFGTQSQHYCRICEALNYNDKKEKIYDEKALQLYLDPNISCS